MRRLINNCCNLALSVVNSNEWREVEKRTLAFVCFIFSTMSITFLHIATASHRSYLNFILPTSRLDKSITSLISLSNSSEFCWIISLHCFRVSLSMDSSVRMEEKPDNALDGVVTQLCSCWKGKGSLSGWNFLLAFSLFPVPAVIGAVFYFLVWPKGWKIQSVWLWIGWWTSSSRGLSSVCLSCPVHFYLFGRGCAIHWFGEYNSLRPKSLCTYWIFHKLHMLPCCFPLV